MKTLCKFALFNVQNTKFSGGGESNQLHFMPQYDQNIPEDQRFSKASPSGDFKIMVDNPVVLEFMKQNVGKQFYITITPADEGSIPSA